ncbi:MAG: family 1 glycosylhydrolase, partial [Caulobacter sp.]
MNDGGVSRRALGALAVGGATAGLAGGLAGCAGPKSGEVQPKSRDFPKDFVWGSATAAFQTEGSPDADGRGPSVWDVFQDLPGKIVDGSDAKVATDSYRRWADDVNLVAGAGLGGYRFSISWSRLLPTGAGAVAQAGIDHYSRLIDGLLEKGV